MVLDIHELRFSSEEGLTPKEILKQGNSKMAADFLKKLQADVREQLTSVLLARLTALARETVPVNAAPVRLRVLPKKVPPSVAAQEAGPGIPEKPNPRGFRMPGGPELARNPLWSCPAVPVNRYAAYGARSGRR